ncbi:MAG: hypothetical protein AB7Q69_14130 [Gemmatimonadales bacterium]
MRSSTRYMVLGMALAAAMLQGCAEGTGPSYLTEGRPRVEGLTVSTDSAALAARITPQAGTPISFSRPLAGLPGILAGAPPVSASFAYQAAASAPTVNGQALPATHIIVSHRLAYVSYGSVGEAQTGAVDVFDLEDPTNPRLVSSAQFTGTKVSTLALDWGARKLYLGTGTADTGFASPAVLEVMDLTGKGLLTSSSVRVDLPSYLVTGVFLRKRDVYVTSGTGGSLPEGGLTVLDSRRLSVKRSESFADARGVGGNGNQIVVAQGSPGQMRIYETSGSPRAILPVGGLTSPGAKSTVEVRANWGFMSLGDGGAAIARVRGVPKSCTFSCGSPIEVVTRIGPAAVPSGASPEDVVTNAIAVDGPLLFLAEGAAGVRVIWSDYERTAQTGTPNAVELGVIGGSDNLPGSNNMVGADDQSLFLANGMGGLRIFSYQTN